MPEPLTIVAHKWNKPGYRSKFGPETVNALYAGFDRWYRKAFRMICVTDDAEGIDGAIGIEPIPTDHADVPSPAGNGNPSCYRRLKMFAPEARDIFGPRVLLIDLDVLPVADVTPIFDRPEPIVLLPTPEKHVPYNGSMILMDTGAFPGVWTDFDPRESPKIAMAAYCHGSDQGWLSYWFRNRSPAVWDEGFGGEGIYTYRRHIEPYGGALPHDARIVLFHGKPDQWEPEAQQLDWVREHWNAAQKRGTHVD